MNRAMEIEQAGVASDSIGKLLSFVGVSFSEKSTQNLTVDAGEVFRRIEKVLKGLIGSAVAARTAVEFSETRSKVFGEYFRTTSAVSDIAQVMIAPRAMEQLIGDSLCEVENTFKEEGLSRFGVEVRDQAVFTTWTLRKIRRLTTQFLKDPVTDESEVKMVKDFAFFLTWTHFHLDCLQMAITQDRIINPEVLAEISDGLRAVVNAYGIVRQGLELQSPQEQAAPSPVIWDSEDQQLLEDSMCDMATERP